MALKTCKSCLSEISNQAAYCPHCGQKQQSTEQTNSDYNAYDGYENEYDEFDQPSNDSQPSNQYTTYSEADKKASTAMVLSLVGFLLPIPVADIICAILGIAYGSQAKNMPHLKRSGQATAGIVVGWIAVVYNVLFWLFLF